MHVLGMELILSKCLANEWFLMQKIESTRQRLKESQLLGVPGRPEREAGNSLRRKKCTRMDLSLTG